MTCAQGLLRLLWGGARSWSATGLADTKTYSLKVRFIASVRDHELAQIDKIMKDVQQDQDGIFSTS